jgi:hypothetical protein
VRACDLTTGRDPRGRGELQPPRLRRDDVGVADEHKADACGPAVLERGAERDFGADAVDIAQGDADAGGH